MEDSAKKGKKETKAFYSPASQRTFQWMLSTGRCRTVDAVSRTTWLIMACYKKYLNKGLKREIAYIVITYPGGKIVQLRSKKSSGLERILLTQALEIFANR